MQLQHVNVKLLVQNPEALDFELLIPIFHGWIEGQTSSELLLDIADYRHVPAGPGVVLIGHEGDYSVDNTDNRPGVRYNRKAPTRGQQSRSFKAGRPGGTDGLSAVGSRAPPERKPALQRSGDRTFCERPFDGPELRCRT